MDIAERNGSLLRRSLRSADRFSDRAISAGSDQVKTPDSRSSASLVLETSRDQFRPLLTMRRHLRLLRAFVPYPRDRQHSLRAEQPLAMFIVDRLDDDSRQPEGNGLQQEALTGVADLR
jgi:hypothetical protein